MAKFKWMLIACIGFCISGYFSLLELRFAMWEKTVQATVTRISEKTERGRRGSTWSVLAVEYTFTDATSGSRNERDDVPTDWPVATGTAAVQYLPGVENSSRLHGHSSTIAVWIFVACLIGLAVAGYQFHKLAHEHDSPPVKRRKRKT